MKYGIGDVTLKKSKLDLSSKQQLKSSPEFKKCFINCFQSKEVSLPRRCVLLMGPTMSKRKIL
ncbi:hypothetical protein GIB67_033769 [Kingdonia uniflora]|uniref:Uncharacterized protein n=1 Tax=Kingdonia uniflora TaxID=39325 RepID=A0A7J7P458_9MAGN|nr:hypothetical protein GIB67_033769 [Kingdonia uniflora]